MKSETLEEDLVLEVHGNSWKSVEVHGSPQKSLEVREVHRSP